MRSHVNQSTFIQYIFVPPSEEDLDLQGLLNNPEDEEALGKAWARQFTKTPMLFFHETYHYWQGLRLPFLYRFAILSHRAIIHAYQQMATLGRPLIEWDCIMPELSRLAIPSRIYWYEDGVLGSYGIGGTTGPPDADATAWWEVTPQGLLETAASVSEFQVTTDQTTRQSPLAFRRWCKRNAAYLDAYDITSKVLGEELALMAVVPIINGAFETSDPLRGFVEILSKVTGGLRSGTLDPFIAQPEPRQWVSLVDLTLREINYESDEEDTLLVGSAFHRVSLDNWVGAIYPSGEPLVHPFLTENAMEWHRRAAVRPAYHWLLAQPAWVHDDVINEALTDLGPQLSFLKFRMPNRDVVITRGNTRLNLSELKRLLTIYSVILRASEVGFDPRNRLCHHASCPLYKSNYCTTYPAIPQDFRSCQFSELHDEMSQYIQSFGARGNGESKNGSSGI